MKPHSGFSFPIVSRAMPIFLVQSPFSWPPKLGMTFWKPEADVSRWAVAIFPAVFHCFQTPKNPGKTIIGKWINQTFRYMSKVFKWFSPWRIMDMVFQPPQNPSKSWSVTIFNRKNPPEQCGWWYTYPSEQYEFVSWNHYSQLNWNIFSTCSPPQNPQESSVG